jgi:hypothetical protein
MLCYHNARESQTRYAFETPWDDDPVVKHFCSDDCGDTSMYEEPWAYFWCDGCDREICEQNPLNGWHIQYRDYDGDQVCLRCYKDLILENGVERKKIESGKIPGMFFDWGNTLAREAGYGEVPGFKKFLINSQERVDEFRKKALELMDEGEKVVVAYERMAMGGDEGYITMMAKRGDS